jgi:hypothetical protein
MTTFRELIEAVNEKNLDKDQLEQYHTEICHVTALMEIELADVEKAGALFLDSSSELTDVAKKRKWRITDQGQREIVLKRYVRAGDKMRSSLKSRIYKLL